MHIKLTRFINEYWMGDNCYRPDSGIWMKVIFPWQINRPKRVHWKTVLFDCKFDRIIHIPLTCARVLLLTCHLIRFNKVAYDQRGEKRW